MSSLSPVSGRRRLLALLTLTCGFLVLTIGPSLGPATFSPLVHRLKPLSTTPTTYHPLECPCERPSSPTPAREGTSTCGEVTERRGLNQSVIAFSIFGGMSSPYFRGIAANAELVPELYPGWTMRVYHDYNMSRPDVRDRLCNLACR